MNQVLIALCMVIAFIFTSCTSEYINDGRVVCFDQEVYPIMVSSCSQPDCHNSNDLKAHLDYTSYNGILKSVYPGSYRKSRLYDVITSTFSPMPPVPYSRLTEAQIITISLWIEQGANIGNTCTAEICDTAFVTFSGTIKPIMNDFCNSCHNGHNAQTPINYSTFAGIKSTIADGKFLGSIKQESGYIAMPKGGGKLSDCKIAEIQKWIEAGAPNN